MIYETFCAMVPLKKIYYLGFFILTFRFLLSLFADDPRRC